MRRAVTLAAVVLVAVGVLAASVVSTAAGSQKKTINIAVFLASAANTYWTASLQGAKDAAKMYRRT